MPISHEKCLSFRKFTSHRDCSNHLQDFELLQTTTSQCTCTALQEDRLQSALWMDSSCNHGWELPSCWNRSGIHPEQPEWSDFDCSLASCISYESHHSLKTCLISGAILADSTLWHCLQCLLYHRAWPSLSGAWLGTRSSNQMDSKWTLAFWCEQIQATFYFFYKILQLQADQKFFVSLYNPALCLAPLILVFLLSSFVMLWYCFDIHVLVPLFSWRHWNILDIVLVLLRP